MDPELARFLFGTDQMVLPPASVNCGPLSLDIDRGALRNIRFAGTEIVRGIDYPIRDENWGSIPSSTLEESTESDEHSFRYVRRFAAGDVIDGEFQCQGSANGELECRLRLFPRTDLSVNRAGFVVLHPIEGVAGSPMTVRHPGEASESLIFPEAISPAQPASDIAGIDLAVHGVAAEMDFAGEVFEMEDQRNWTDASYKTYCRPLSLAAPYVLSNGQAVEQSISIRFGGVPKLRAEAEPRTLGLMGRIGTLPAIAYALEPRWTGSTAIELPSAQATVLRLDLTGETREAGLAETLKRVSGILEIEAVVPDEEAAIERALARLRNDLEAQGTRPATIVALPAAYLRSYQPDGRWPDGATPEQAAVIAGRLFPSSRVGCGMLTNFTELNRCPSAARAGSFFTHGSTAIVHAADDVSVMQSLEALPHVFASGAALAPGQPCRLGLASIGMRTNPYGAGLMDNPASERMPMAGVDPRQRGLFAAAFMVGVMGATEATAIERIALAAPSGPFGLADGDRVYPALPAFAWFCAKSGLTRIGTLTPPGIAAVAAEANGRTHIILANTTATSALVELPTEAQFQVVDRPEHLKGGNVVAETVHGKELELGPYGIAFATLGSAD